MFDWDEGDRFSFEDSDRFEEDSLCSWMSEPESVCNNWRGWKKMQANGNGNGSGQGPLYAGLFGGTFTRSVVKEGQVLSLVELAAREVACHIPFEVVEHVYPPVPEQLQLRIAYWSFPENEEDIRLYSCLANGSADEFQRGENLLKAKGVKDLLQIGFHLSATVVPPQSLSTSKGSYSVAVTFDRRRITSCNCTCVSPASWCSHVVSVCLFRIHQPAQVCLRAPVSESLSRLHRDQLQKFAQYLISELPQQILPTAQRLLDELLSNQRSAINSLCGAPDPTAGASAHEQTSWCLDESQLHENIRKILIKLCVPSPIVFSDVNYLSSTAPPAAAEWSSLLRPLRGREPEGMWNLLSIVREMFRRGDRNAIPLLEILTEEVLACDQIVLWWFNTRVSLHAGGYGHGNRGSIHSNTHASQHACSSLCDEIVVLWRLACLNPGLSPQDKSNFYGQLRDWHIKTLERVWKMRSTGGGGAGNGNGGGNGNNQGPGNGGSGGMKKNDFEVFPGFKPSLEACLLEWIDYPIPGVTFSESCSRRWYCPCAHAHHPKETLVSQKQDPLLSALSVSSPPMVSGVTSGCVANGKVGLRGSRGRSVDIGPCSEWRVTPAGGSHQVVPPCSSTSASTGSCSLSVIQSSSDINNGPATQGLNHSHPEPRGNNGKLLESNRSSFSSEGFCETSETEQFDSDTVVGALSASPRNVQSDLLGEKSNYCTDLEESRLTYSPNAHSSSPPRTSHEVLVNSSSSDSCDKDAAEGEDPEALGQDKSSEAALELLDQDKAVNSKEVKEEKDKKEAAASGGQYNFESPKGEENLVAAPAIVGVEVEPEAGGRNSAAHSQRRQAASNEPFGERFDVTVKKNEDPLEILFARAEALHAHGLTREACRLAVQLAEEMLTNPPNLMVEVPSLPTRGKRGRRFNPACHQISLLASTTLSKAAFLCSVLSENVEHYHLAFRVGLFGLEMARPPASTKPLEVKLANQEQDLVIFLKRLPLASKQLQVLREKAEQLREGRLRSRGDALLPLMLASYIFEALILSLNQQTRSGPSISGRLPADESLGFEAAVAALGLKANVSEAEHPLLCEGTRRQRGELAITLLVYYKDDQEKLAKIMDRLLDKEVHQMYKNPITGNYAATPGGSESAVTPGSPVSSTLKEPLAAGAAPAADTLSNSSSNSDESESRDQGICLQTGAEGGLSCSYPRASSEMGRDRISSSERRPSDGDRSEGATSPCWDEDFKAWEARFRCTNLKTTKKHSVGMASIDSSAPETTSSDNSPTVVRRSLWMRPGGPGPGPGSDSGSSGESSDSFASSSSGDKIPGKGKPGIVVPGSGSAPGTGPEGIREAADGSPPLGVTPVASMPSIVNRLGNCSISDPSMSCSPTTRCPLTSPTTVPSQVPTNGTLSTANNASPPSLATPPSTSASTSGPVTVSAPNNQPIKPSRFKGKRIYPSIPNQPSEASAHFMFELAKTVLTKAGGNSSTAVLFTQPTSSQNHRGPHRALHMCAFQIGVYALGLHNAVSPNWLSRTYSSHVSWITGQAMEIGAAAINFLIETWESHLTPPEVASLADRASRGRDPAMVRAAAKLALSCLPHAHALNPNEIQRALIQCKEQSSDMLEQACLAVESAAKGGGVYPEVLFEVARKWFELYEESLQENSGTGRGAQGNGQRRSSRAPYVQASIGEFQVPTSNANVPNGGGHFGLHGDQSQGMMNGNQMDRQAHVEGYIGVPSVVQQQVSGPVAAPPTLQVLPQISCAPGTFALPHPGPPYSYGYFQGIPTFPQAPPITLHPAYIPNVTVTSSFQYPYYAPNPVTTTAAAMVAALPHLRNVMASPNPLFHNQTMLSNVVVTQAAAQAAVSQAQTRLQMLTGGPPQGAVALPMVTGVGLPQHMGVNPCNPMAHLTPQPQQPLQQLNQRQLGYLLSAYRVGMLAMETLARRVHDDRPQAKYARNPSYGEDVKWLLNVGKKLGPSHLQDFCICTVNSVASPFVLYEIVVEAAQYLSQSNVPPVTTQPLRSPLITPLIQKCQQMFIACTHFKMFHITPADYEEFVQIVRSARQAFTLTPGGMVQFNELLQSLRRSKSCKKDLWQHLSNSLQQNPSNI